MRILDPLIVLAFFASPAFLVAMVVASIRARRPRFRWLLAAAGSFAIFIVAATLAGSPVPRAAPAAPRTLPPLRVGLRASKFVKTKRAVGQAASKALRDRESAASLPRYLELRVGQRALLNSNDEGDGSVGTLFDDMDTVLKWAAGPSEPEELAHYDLPTGTPVSVQSWTHVKASGSFAVEDGRRYRGRRGDLPVSRSILPSHRRHDGGCRKRQEH